MNTNLILNQKRIWLLATYLALYGAIELPAQEPPRLSAKGFNEGLELSWPATAQKVDGSVVRPYFELQRSYDFQHWQPVGERHRAATARGASMLSATLGLAEPHAYYRLLSIEPTATTKLGSGGAE